MLDEGHLHQHHGVHAGPAVILTVKRSPSHTAAPSPPPHQSCEANDPAAPGFPYPLFPPRHDPVSHVSASLFTHIYFTSCERKSPARAGLFRQAEAQGGYPLGLILYKQSAKLIQFLQLLILHRAVGLSYHLLFELPQPTKQIVHQHRYQLYHSSGILIFLVKMIVILYSVPFQF